MKNKNWVVNLDYQQLYPNIQKSYGIYPERLKIIRRITKIKRLFNTSS